MNQINVVMSLTRLNMLLGGDVEKLTSRATR